MYFNTEDVLPPQEEMVFSSLAEHLHPESEVFRLYNFSPQRPLRVTMDRGSPQDLPAFFAQKQVRGLADKVHDTRASEA